jgi:hypothetical protein
MKYWYLAAAFALSTTGCNNGTSDNTAAGKPEANQSSTAKKQTAQAPATKTPVATPAKSENATAPTSSTVAAKQEVIFDPKNPPPGFGACHRNHCHRLGGGVASYAQVMKEIGATKSINVPKRAPMPKAPADVAGPGADTEVTGSGIASKVLNPGSGKVKPKLTDTVSVHYTGWTTDGKAFDSSVARGAPATFPLNRVIPGWSEGVQLMTVGEERRFWIPGHLAYDGRRGAPQGMLVFDVELLSIK